MRQPTPVSEQYAWYERALASGGRIDRFEDVPECGWFRRRFVKGGPFVPLRIWLEQEIDYETGELVAPEVMRCKIGRNLADPLYHWPSAEPITYDEYTELLRLHTEDPSMQATHAPLDITSKPVRPPRP